MRYLEVEMDGEASFVVINDDYKNWEIIGAPLFSVRVLRIRCL